MYITIAARRFPWMFGSLLFVLAALGWWGYTALIHPPQVVRTRPIVADVGVPKVVPQADPSPQSSVITPIAAPIVPAKAAPKVSWSLPILMYHYVRVVDPQQDPLGYRLSVTREQLAAQLDYLVSHGYHTIDPALLLSGNPLPAKSIMLTFDDGYEDFATAGWPVVKAHQMTAMQFVVTGFMGHDPYLTSDQVRQLSSEGVIIGAHTIHHVNLATQTPDRLALELAQPKATLEQLLGKPVRFVAYPSGKFNDDVLAATKRAGYQIGFTTQFGLATNLDNPLAIHRIEILGSDSIASFAQKLTGKLASATGITGQ